MFPRNSDRLEWLREHLAGPGAGQRSPELFEAWCAPGGPGYGCPRRDAWNTFAAASSTLLVSGGAVRVLGRYVLAGPGVSVG